MPVSEKIREGVPLVSMDQIFPTSELKLDVVQLCETQKVIRIFVIFVNYIASLMFLQI